MGLLLLAPLFAAALELPPGVANTQNPADHPLSPQEALKRITLPEGFRVTLFAAEPDVLQPIAFDFDDRGRVWVVENFSYPDFKNEDADRVVILADRDGDGQSDERKVFLAGGHRLSGIAWGFGGVWLCSAPNLIFVPDANGDDKPDGPPVAHLDGFTLRAQHNMVNGLAWGPDGWLYGRHGITAPSLVGPPGRPETERLKFSCSIWRYHPTKHLFEVVTHGTTNPWGLDWDDFGQPFFSNNVIDHFWQVVPGAHYKRMFGEDLSPRVYKLMSSCSDHKHWAGSDWTKSRGGRGEHDALGGGHSHCGLMIYLGDNWPDTYRGCAFMGNLHGNRLVYDRLERKGSGSVARHGGDFLKANDPWFRSVSQHYGPDGAALVSDWHDLGECHDTDGTHRTSGRIYKVAYGQTKLQPGLNLARLDDPELVRLQLHRNDWLVRHARRLLQERAVAGMLSRVTRPELLAIFRENRDATRKLRALWALHAIGACDEGFLLQQLEHDNENVRWWATQFLCEERKASPAVLARFAEMARLDPSPMVRLGLASALQRLPLPDRWEMAIALAAQAEDSADQNLPLMLWYAVEPLVPADPARAVQLAARCKIPLLRQFISRRLAED
jgi:putative membrane-bound dehydrogenase-like protein